MQSIFKAKYFGATLSAFVISLAAERAEAAAPGFLYDCDMREVGSFRGWVSPKIAIVLPGDGTAQVVDALTLTFSQDVVPGTILRDDPQRFIVRWSLEDARTDSGQSFGAFDYRASIAKRTGRIDLTAAPRASDTPLVASGTCRRRTR